MQQQWVFVLVYCKREEWSVLRRDKLLTWPLFYREETQREQPIPGRGFLFLTRNFLFFYRREDYKRRESFLRVTPTPLWPRSLVSLDSLSLSITMFTRGVRVTSSLRAFHGSKGQVRALASQASVSWRIQSILKVKDLLNVC